MYTKLRNHIISKIKDPIDIYGAVRPLFVLCNYVGLAPYSLKQNPNGTKSFQFNWKSTLKSIAVVTFFFVIFAFSIYQTENPFKRNEDIKYKIRYIQEIFAALLSAFEILIGICFALKMIEVFKNIEEVDTLFKSLAVWVAYKKTYVAVLFHLAIFAVCLVSSAVFLLIIDSLGSEDNTEILMNFLTYSTKHLPYSINILMEMQYMHCLYIIRLRYILLNEYLESLVEENNSYNGWMSKQISTIDSKTDEKSSAKRLPKGIISITDPVFIIDQVASLHIKLTDTAQLINTAFSVQQLLRITIAFVSIVTALFSIAMNFAASNNGDVELDIYFTLWAFSNAIEVISIVWITSETCEEANTCPRILHKIRNHTSNIKLQDTIEIYSLQMFHNKLYFTVCGLFPLDYTLLYTIVAGVTTYLVILIQFNIEFVQSGNATTVTESSAI